MSERIDNIVKGIAGLDPNKDYTSGGLPKVETLEAITGIEEITGKERNEAWEIHQANAKLPDIPDDSADKSGSEDTTPSEDGDESPKDDDTPSDDDTPTETTDTPSDDDTPPETTDTPSEDEEESKTEDEVPEIPKPKKVAVETPVKVEKPKVAVKKAPFTIAKGKALTSLKGILGEGAPVTPECFPGGEETFNDLVKKHYIDDNGS